MSLSLGVDLVYLPKFKSLSAGTSAKVFDAEELGVGSVQSLAGIFAAKEAFFKALGRPDDWLKISVRHKTSGEPYIESSLLAPGQSVKLSISHDGDYVMATVIIF